MAKRASKRALNPRYRRRRRLTHYFRYVLGAEVDVKCHKLPHRAALGQAIPQVLNGVDGREEISSGRMQRDADRRIPPADDVNVSLNSRFNGRSRVSPLEQRHQVVQEGVVGVRRVRNRLEALQLAVLGSDVVLQHPKVAALFRVWLIIFIMAI